jgi:hypothetical protein
MLSPKKGEGRRVVPNGESACLANTGSGFNPHYYYYYYYYY